MVKNLKHVPYVTQKKKMDIEVNENGKQQDWETRLGTGNVNSIIDTVNEDGSMSYDTKYIDMKLGNKCDLNV